MDLKSALKIALKFARKTDDPKDSFGYVQFFAAEGERGPMLSAQNIRCGVTIRLDEAVPARVLPECVLRQVAAAADLGIIVRATGYGSIEILAGGARYAVAHDDTPHAIRWPACRLGPWPGEQGFVGFKTLDLDPILQVSHAVSKDKSREDLRSIRFRLGTVEATDRSRVAMARTSGTYDGLLPVTLFQGLRSGAGVLSRSGPGGMELSIGDQELRWAEHLPMEYPDAGDLIPKAHEGPEMVVDAKQLGKLARQCSKISVTGSVEVLFQAGTVTLTSWQAPEADGKPRAYQARMGAVRPQGSPVKEGSVVVAGRALADAAGAVRTPRVRLQYGRPVDPLRMESAGLLECLWPMLM